MNLAEARQGAIEAVEKAEAYRDFKPHSPVVQAMLNGDAVAALKVYETAIIIERAS